MRLGRPSRAAVIGLVLALGITACSGDSTTTSAPTSTAAANGGLEKTEIKVVGLLSHRHGRPVRGHRPETVREGGAQGHAADRAVVPPRPFPCS
ncbi:hypothetical protein ACFSTC_45645 [Nonomuraea ferruginea]